MDLRHSYFAISSPFKIIDRWLNPYHFNSSVLLNQQNLKINLTNRAEKALHTRSKPLIAEMQLYFSCVVKKRVLFHDSLERNSVNVNKNLAVDFRAVSASSCSPEEFAKNYPVDTEFTSNAALQMRPTELMIDYNQGEWTGEFNI